MVRASLILHAPVFVRLLLAHLGSDELVIDADVDRTHGDDALRMEGAAHIASLWNAGVLAAAGRESGYVDLAWFVGHDANVVHFEQVVPLRGCDRGLCCDECGGSEAGDHGEGISELHCGCAALVGGFCGDLDSS